MKRNYSQYISQGDFALAAYYFRQKDTLKCWETLRDAGDVYAGIACHVFSGQWSWINCVRQFHWQWTTGYTFDDATWKTIGRNAQECYLRIVGRHAVVSETGEVKLRLPNTRAIEHCYLKALHDAGIPSASLMHVAANQFARPINLCFEGAAKGLAKIAPRPVAARLRRFDMPDWHEVLGPGFGFGEIGGRGVDNCATVTNVGYWRNAANLAVAISVGTINYLCGPKVKSAPRVMRPLP